MKTIELFCASPASTAICSSMDHRAIIRLGGDTPRPKTNAAAAPCSSHLPFDPSKPFYHQKPRKGSSSAKQQNHEILRRKSSADVEDLNSSKYLLSDKPFLDDSERALIRDSNNNNNDNYKKLNLDRLRAYRSLSTRAACESPVYNPSSTRYNSPRAEKISSGKLTDHLNAQKIASGKLSDHLNAQKTLSASSNRQVVELKVSIHCKGCEGKLRKHISRMEGVTSFSIDLATKKVTVIGDVTPLGVLTSISKVKNAQFWPSPASSSSSSSPRVSLTRDIN